MLIASIIHANKPGACPQKEDRIMAEGDKHLVIPVRPDTADVTLKVSTGKDDPEAGTRKAAGEFPATLPKDLGSAVRLEADLNHCGLEEASKIVYKKYLLSKEIGRAHV